VLVSLLTSAEAAELDLVQEERCCAGLGMTFVSFPIDDRGVPASQAVARQVIESLREMHRQGHGVGMHCRYGVGRAPMMAAAFLSALGIPAAEAFGAIAAARGCNVPDTEAQGEWVVRMGAEFGD
jgi:protein-tyrosine phosphatase